MKGPFIKNIYYILIVLTGLGANSVSSAPIPDQAKTQGYLINTFNSKFTESNSIDLEDVRRPGFKWYVGRFFGWDPTPIEHLEILDNQYLRIKTTGKNSNFAISTATRVKAPKRWVGQAFGGGGYFEAEIRFNPSDSFNKHGWPSFWSMSIEHMASLAESQWFGQKSGYSHFIEVDIMEYVIKDPQNKSVYGANIHDWYGVWKDSCAPKNFCKHSLPYKKVRKITHTEIDSEKFNKYGFLWVPASKVSQGWAQFYFNDKPIGKRTSWKLFENQSPSSEKKPWTFGILDQHHITLILGTGKNQPMDIRAVRVWQKSNDSNWIQ